jgi:hypothetical protein
MKRCVIPLPFKQMMSLLDDQYHDGELKAIFRFIAPVEILTVWPRKVHDGGNVDTFSPSTSTVNG